MHSSDRDRADVDLSLAGSLWHPFQTSSLGITVVRPLEDGEVPVLASQVGA